MPRHGLRVNVGTILSSHHPVWPETAELIDFTHIVHVSEVESIAFRDPVLTKLGSCSLVVTSGWHTLQIDAFWKFHFNE